MKTVEKLEAAYTISDINDSTIVVDFAANSVTVTKAEMMGTETTTTMNNKSTGKIILDKLPVSCGKKQSIPNQMAIQNLRLAHCRLHQKQLRYYSETGYNRMNQVIFQPGSATSHPAHPFCGSVVPFHLLSLLQPV